jgi:hypothetical protein
MLAGWFLLRLGEPHPVNAQDTLGRRNSAADSVHLRTLTVVDGQLVAVDSSGPTHPPLREVRNHAFQDGEVLRYVVRYGPIVAGSAQLSLDEIVLFRGRPCFRIVSRAWSNSFFSNFYRVDDRVESLTDRDGLFSWWAEKHLREGSFRADQHAEFDQEDHTIYFNRDTLRQISPFVQDVLSAMYFLRTLPLQVGEEILLDAFSDGKLYPLQIRVFGHERIRTRAGRFDCLVVEPFLQTPALFNQKGRIQVWLSNDNRKIPVLMKSQIYVSAFKLGSVIAELEEMEGVVRKDPQ